MTTELPARFTMPVDGISTYILNICFPPGHEMSDIQQQLYTKLDKSFRTLRGSTDYNVKNQEATSIINDLHNFIMASQNPVNLKQRINDAIN